MNYGFIAPRIEPEDYFLGSGLLGSQVINPSGDWRNYLPLMELQNRGFEPNACVSFAILNALEILHKFHYKVEVNKSDRFLAKMSGTDPNNGNTPKKVADTLRHSGAVPEEEWPYDNSSLENYYKEIPQRVIDMGLDFLSLNLWGYEWADTSQLKSALQRSPVCVAVNAWTANEKGEYVRFGTSNHYVTLVAIDELNRPIIFDSYNDGLKVLEAGYLFEFPQLYKLSQKEPVKGEWTQTGFWGKIKLLARHFFLWK